MSIIAQHFMFKRIEISVSAQYSIGRQRMRHTTSDIIAPSKHINRMAQIFIEVNTRSVRGIHGIHISRRIHIGNAQCHSRHNDLRSISLDGTIQPLYALLND
ncbi:hypothetical protein DF200_06095 [Bifidobacterium catulorum]|uniref:Uncharacterized protein n=1 Tax=Bifidobacterium catulorum TaxID=1630173 RepID=A0A2U2MS64_9BIFI|nr:hypothetical protein DF200_06095 [Bifidobacterium catulorum]